jgi:predicted nuclease of predicted toxin-antitoxin system
VKFLVDNALSPIVALGLRRLGHDAVHVRERNLQEAEDEVVLQSACREHRIVITADTDFPALTALWHSSEPSIIFFKTRGCRRPFQQLAVLRSNLPKLENDLLTGAIVVIEDRRIRIRRLPIGGTEPEGTQEAHETRAAYKVERRRKKAHKRK